MRRPLFLQNLLMTWSNTTVIIDHIRGSKLHFFISTKWYSFFKSLKYIWGFGNLCLPTPWSVQYLLETEIDLCKRFLKLNFTKTQVEVKWKRFVGPLSIIQKNNENMHHSAPSRWLEENFNTVYGDRRVYRLSLWSWTA